MNKLRFLLFISLILIIKVSYSQSVYYSVNGATNPNLLNSWTKDISGSTLLLPPIDFGSSLDTFIIDGENMTISDNWVVAGELRVLKGSLSDPDRFKFQAKVLSIYDKISYLFIGNPGDIHVGSLIIGPDGQLNTGNSYGGNSIQVDDSAYIKGNLLITNPMFGTGKFILEKGGTLSTTNGEIAKTGNIGQIRVSGSRCFSKEAKYHFTSNVGSFYTGDALPDTVAELYIDNEENTTTIFSSSTTILGTFSSAGAWGGSNANSFILLGSNKIKCLGTISIGGGVKFSGNASSALIISGNNTSSFTLPAITVDSFAFDRPAQLTLNGNLTAISQLNLLKGIIKTGSYLVQLGTSKEGIAYQTQGWINGTFACIKDQISTTSLLFPVGGNNYAGPLTIAYTTPPTSEGLIKVSFIDNSGTTTLNPSISDGTNIISYYSNFYWQVDPILVSGGAFNVSINAKDITSLTKSKNSTLLLSNIEGSQFYINGKRSLGSDILINRDSLSGSTAFGKYYIGWDNTNPTFIENINNISSASLLKSNYPNPFKQCTKIKYFIAHKSFVSLKIFDSKGNEISNLVNNEQLEGEYEVLFDGSDYPNGIYFCQLKTGNSLSSIKIILVK